jgi:hypothetical protein
MPANGNGREGKAGPCQNGHESGGPDEMAQSGEYQERGGRATRFRWAKDKAMLGFVPDVEPFRCARCGGACCFPDKTLSHGRFKGGPWVLAGLPKEESEAAPRQAPVLQVG